MRTFTIHSSHGDLFIDEDGNVVSENPPPQLKFIKRFNLKEYRETYPNEEIDGIDILDIGYWHGKKGQVYEPAEPDFRAEVKRDAEEQKQKNDEARATFVAAQNASPLTPLEVGNSMQIRVVPEAPLAVSPDERDKNAQGKNLPLGFSAPQPWRLEMRSSCIALIDARGQEILFIQLHPENGENGSITARERTNADIIATARLIALAPQLLHGCQIALNELDDPSGPTGVAMKLRGLIAKTRSTEAL